MIKKIFIIIAFLLLYYGSSAQVLSVNAVIQEQNQWCWTAASACVLSYYGVTKSQCEIAEYTRSVATWHNFGSVNCCVDPTQGCNYWNYHYTYLGSIEDIMNYFGGLSAYGVGTPLTKETIAADLGANRLFTIRWGYTSGGGHFLVGHGLSGNNLHYMDPWYGEGLKVANYDWVVSSSNHAWTSTNRLAITTPVHEPITCSEWAVFPNPFQSQLVIKNTGNIKEMNFEITAISGQIIKSGTLSEKKVLDTLSLAPGFYLIRIKDDINSFVYKIVKQ